MTQEQVDVEVSKQKKGWLNDTKQLISTKIHQKAYRKVNVDDGDPGALNINPYTKILSSAGRVDRERNGIGKVRDEDHCEASTTTAATSSRQKSMHIRVGKVELESKKGLLQTDDLADSEKKEHVTDGR